MITDEFREQVYLKIDAMQPGEVLKLKPESAGYQDFVDIIKEMVQNKVAEIDYDATNHTVTIPKPMSRADVEHMLYEIVAKKPRTKFNLKAKKEKPNWPIFLNFAKELIAEVPLYGFSFGKNYEYIVFYDNDFSKKISQELLESVQNGKK